MSLLHWCQTSALLSVWWVDDRELSLNVNIIARNSSAHTSALCT